MTACGGFHQGRACSVKNHGHCDMTSICRVRWSSLQPESFERSRFQGDSSKLQFACQTSSSCSSSRCQHYDCRRKPALSWSVILHALVFVSDQMSCTHRTSKTNTPRGTRVRSSMSLQDRRYKIHRVAKPDHATPNHKLDTSIAHMTLQ